MKTTLPTLCAFCSFCLSPLFAAVGDKATWPSFAEPPLFGSAVSADDLRGKVVFFEYWGINCPPCRASMPHLQELQEKYGSKGFTVLGSHCQTNGPNVVEFLKQARVTFPVYQGISIPEAPIPGGIPFAALIGTDGKVVAMGYPGTLYDKVEAEMAKCTGGYPILSGLELKKYKSLAKSLVPNGRNIEAKLVSVREEADKGNEEAAEICKAYDAWLEEEKQLVRGQCAQNPLRAMKAIVRLKTAVPSVTEFDADLQAYRESPAVQKLADIQKKLQTLQRNREKGRRISKPAVNALLQSLDDVGKMQKDGLGQCCRELAAQLRTLLPNDDVRASR